MEAIAHLKNISLSYHSPKGETKALDNVTFDIYDGEFLSIVGPSGCGKSTLLSVISGLSLPSEGTVKIEGVDVKEFNKEELGMKVGIVPQKALLFKGTIRSNLLWGNENATEEDMIMALKRSQSYDFVMQKENGIDSVVEQNGRNFSGGQRQRLTIARALVRKPEILILDDSSSALDYTTDANLRKEIAKLKDMTVFIVSQRTASIMDADQIVVLDDGNVMGIGTHKDLLENCEVYKEIYESQFKKPEKEEM